jgi:hypothetical protein
MVTTVILVDAHVILQLIFQVFLSVSSRRARDGETEALNPPAELYLSIRARVALAFPLSGTTELSVTLIVLMLEFSATVGFDVMI